jgi:hypothetical protein
MLSAYAAENASFPAFAALHPERPVWKWGRWADGLSQEYLDGKLKPDVREAMEICPHWRAKLAAMREKREGKATQEKIPTRLEQVQMLSEYAAENGSSFPPRGAPHPERPEWKWGRWVNDLSQEYLDGKLKPDVRKAMEICPHWRAKLAALRKKREAKAAR